MTVKELLALVTTVRHFRFICVRHFKVQRKRGTLKTIMNFKNLESKTARWMTILGIYKS